MRLDMRLHRGGVDGVGRVKEELLAGGRTSIYTGASAWRSRGVQGLVILPEKTPRRTVFQFGPQNWSGGPVRLGSPEGFQVWTSKSGVASGAAGPPGRFPGLGLKTRGGARCGWVARMVW